MSLCRAIKLPEGNICGTPATHRVTFSDGDAIETCLACSLSLVELARSHGTRIKTEPLEKTT